MFFKMCIRDSYNTLSMRILLCKTEEISLIKTPKRTGEELVPTTPFSSYTSWVHDTPGSATMDASERDHWTSLQEIPTPKNRTDKCHSTPHLLTCHPPKSSIPGLDLSLIHI